MFKRIPLQNKASRSGVSILQYKDLNTVATLLFSLDKSKTEYFELKLKQDSKGIATIMGWTVDKRDHDLTSMESLSLDIMPNEKIYNEIKSWKMNGDDYVYLIEL
jgi:hypothetical protein